MKAARLKALDCRSRPRQRRVCDVLRPQLGHSLQRVMNLGGRCVHTAPSLATSLQDGDRNTQAAGLLQPGLEKGCLSTSGREVFSAVGRAVLDRALPDEEGARQMALNGLLGRIDTLVLGLPTHAQAGLSQLLSLLASAGGQRALAGLSQPWAEASVDQIQKALQGTRLSSLALRQQAYAALHEISAGA